MKKFTEILQTDGYSGYKNLRKRVDIISVARLSNTRRKFLEVFNPEGVAAQMIAKLKPLYTMKTKLRELGLRFRTRKRLRQKQIRSILKSICSLLKQQIQTAPP